VTPEQQRIAVAKACGYWFYKESTDINTRVYAGPPGSGRYRFLGYVGAATAGKSPLPDYLNDLNAMHEAEKVLNGSQSREYGQWILPLYGYAWSATAAQRAEAFLRTLNLWEDDK
jgi:hypothetical protein